MMTKELAAKIIELNIEAQRISNERFMIAREFKLTWDEVCTQAMKFLMEATNVKS